MIFIARGVAHLGTLTKDAGGNVVRKTEASFEETKDGNTIVIGEIDPETMKINEPVTAMFGKADASRYLRAILARLNIRKEETDLPPLEEIVIGLHRENSYAFCRKCSKGNLACNDCVVTEWVDAFENEMEEED